MGGFLRFSVCFCIAVASIGRGGAQEQDMQYMRSSLYSILVAHPEVKYARQIDYVYLNLPPSDKYENHDLNVRRVEARGAKWVDHLQIDEFLERNEVARRMVAKWFDRNSETGVFDVDLVAERGNYNASEMDVQKARMSKRGLAMLSDAGENLIGNTFVTVHDIVYIDKEQQAKVASSILMGIAKVAAVATVVSGGSENSTATAISSYVTASALLGSIIADNLSGFTVKVRTHLYRLNWNDSIADLFYSDYWVDENTPEEERLRRKRLFEESPLFALEYIGSYKHKSQKTVLKGLYSNEDIIRKVCARAMDRSIVGLQQKYEVFKVKTPVIAVENGRIHAKIGMKEGITSSSKFEVLQPVAKEDGTFIYRRVGKISPVKREIWDNRYMAFEEEAVGSERTFTTFKTRSGGPFYQGMLIRQLK